MLHISILVQVFYSLAINQSSLAEKWVVVTLVSFLLIIQYLFLWPLCLHFQDGSYSRGPVDIEIGEYDESKYFLSPTYKFEQVRLLHLHLHFQFLWTTWKRFRLTWLISILVVLSRIGCFLTTYMHISIFEQLFFEKITRQVHVIFLFPLVYMWMP